MTHSFRLIRTLILLALPLAVYSSGSAASLQGRVTQVIDGRTIVVVSVNQPIKIRLIAATAPEAMQSYAAIAQQHLSDLILNKYVLVRFSALQEGYLVGQVMLGDMDVCVQMIRDGVAWYDKSDASNLNEAERKVYEASQEAARNERRGLWQDESPVSPWDFRKAQLATVRPSAVSVPRRASPVRRGNAGGLSSEDLMGGVIGPGSLAGKPNIKPLSSDGSHGRWLRYQPADRHFSILAPSDGFEITYPILDGQGKAMDLHYVIGGSSRSLYFLLWTKGSNGGETDVTAAENAIKGMLNQSNLARQRLGAPVLTASPGRNVKLEGYAGRQYSLGDGTISGVVRVLSKQFGDERELFLLCVLSAPDSEDSSAEFLNSFKLNQTQAH